MAAATIVFSSNTTAKAAEEGTLSRRVPEIGQVKVPVADFSNSSGWLILNPITRRGYSLAESGAETIVESFDLDTLQPLQRTAIPGLPIATEMGSASAGSAYNAGEVVHAVDQEAKRIYIAFGQTFTTGVAGLNGSESRRMALRFVVLDEVRFDTDPGHAFGAFTPPASEAALADYTLMGMRVTREHTPPGAKGKILAAFASPYPASNAPGASAPIPGPFHHILVQWDVSGVQTNQVPPGFLSPIVPLTAPDWEEHLYACGTAPMSSTGSSDATIIGVKNYQWGILPTKNAIYLGCQSAPASGAVVRVPLEQETGQPTPGLDQEMVPLGKPIADTMVDPGGGRIYLKSFGGDGATWWAFDVLEMRYVGSIATGLLNGQVTAAGLDEGTGRLYTFTADICVPRRGGGALPVRGGLRIVDARLDPVPATENVRPDLAYNSTYRIKVDPVTRRVFLRRGNALHRFRAAYPGCETSVESPVEPHYRVLEDHVPVAQAPAELDDAAFTTNVPEKKGLTEVSFLGEGSGFGSRVILTGGIDAVTRGALTTVQSQCGRDDRELLIGSVGGVEVTNQSTRADAASLDGDPRTREDMGLPITRCRPQAQPNQVSDEEQRDQLNRCHGDVQELAFDDVYTDEQGRTKDDNKDGCPDGTGVNSYAAQCNQDYDSGLASGPSRSIVPRDMANPRHGFKADVRCSPESETATGTADGSLSSDRLSKMQEDYAGSGAPQGPMTVARSRVEVTVTREFGKGVTVEVDAIARGIEIPAIGSIGVVRSVAKSTSTGRDGRAEGTYKRTICDVHIGDTHVPGCVGSDEQHAILVERLNSTLAGRAEIRLRQPDGGLLDGTPHGYLAGVQRDRRELFGDRTITKDNSFAIPGLEIILFIGDGGPWGAGRQVLQLAGVQATTSYGIICTFGQAANGKCSEDVMSTESLLDLESGLDEGIDDPGDVNAVPDDGGNTDDGGDEPAVITLLRKIPEAIAQALRLLFNNPRELMLMAAVWALLYAPCYLGERRRSIRGLQNRRAGVGGVA